MDKNDEHKILAELAEAVEICSESLSNAVDKLSEAGTLMIWSLSALEQAKIAYQYLFAREADDNSTLLALGKRVVNFRQDLQETIAKLKERLSPIEFKSTSEEG